MLRLRSGNFLWCCHDNGLNPQQGLTCRSPVGPLKIVSTASFSDSNTHMHTHELSLVSIDNQSGCVAQSSVSILYSTGMSMAQQSMHYTDCTTRWFPELFCISIMFIRTENCSGTSLPPPPFSFSPGCLSRQHFEKHTKNQNPGKVDFFFFLFIQECFCT